MKICNNIISKKKLNQNKTGIELKVIQPHWGFLWIDGSNSDIMFFLMTEFLPLQLEQKIT